MKHTALLVLAILSISLLSATVTARHDPPISLKAEREIVLTLEVLQGFEEIDKVDLYYREGGSQTYINISQDSQPDPAYTFTAPALEHPEKGLEYYFEITTTNGAVQSLPSVQPGINPYRVQFDSVETPSDGFVRLSPESMFVPAGQPLMIAISTFAIADEIDKETIKITFDGRDMTDMATVAGVMVVLQIDNPKPGEHSYQVTAETKDGRRIVSRRWTNKSEGGATFAMPWNMTGSIEMNSLTRSYSADDFSSYSSDNDYKYADWKIRMRGRKDWFGFFTRLLLTSRESSSAQSVNRYAVGFTTEWVDLTIGDTSPQYDSFTMNNKNIRGLHALLHSQDFRLYIDWGANRQAIEDGDTSFKRNTLGIRSEVGEQGKFVWGVSVVKNKDDMDSIDESYYVEETAYGDTTLTTVTLKPKDNILIGTDFFIPAIPRKLEFGMELALSYLNNNIYDGAWTEEEMEEHGYDDIPFDPESIESIIVFNSNLEPFLPGIDNVAYRGFMNFNMGGNFLTASYASVGSSFNSLSANYVQKDAAIISLTDNVMLFRNQLLLSGGLNIVTDNQSGQKEQTNTNSSFFLQTVFRPADWPTLKLGFSQTSASDDSDPLVDVNNGYQYGLEQTSQSFNVGACYEFIQIIPAPTTLEVNYQQTTSVDDLNKSYDNSMSTISVGAVTRVQDFPVTTTVRFSTSTNDMETINLDNGNDYTTKVMDKASDRYNSILLRANFRFLEDKLKPFVSAQFNSFSGDDSDDQSTNLFGLGVGYDIFENLEASTSLNLKNYTNNDTDDANYSKTDWRLRLRYTF